VSQVRFFYLGASSGEDICERLDGGIDRTTKCHVELWDWVVKRFYCGAPWDNNVGFLGVES